MWVRVLFVKIKISCGLKVITENRIEFNVTTRNITDNHNLQFRVYYHIGENLWNMFRLKLCVMGSFPCLDHIYTPFCRLLPRANINVLYSMLTVPPMIYVKYRIFDIVWYFTFPLLFLAMGTMSPPQTVSLKFLFSLFKFEENFYLL